MGKEVLSRPVKMHSDDFHLECELAVDEPESSGLKLASRRSLKLRALSGLSKK